MPCIWALRKPTWSKDEKDAPPDGFGERTRNNGIPVFGWAPHMDIPARPSIADSLFHSGWGSVTKERIAIWPVW